MRLQSSYLLALCFLFQMLVPNDEAFGQATVPDTLDWRGYYPLEVGNVWELSTHILVAFHAKDVIEIVGDTTINSRSYFVESYYRQAIDENFGSLEITSGRRYLRYDTLRTRVVRWDINGAQDVDYTCDLSIDFNAQPDCGGTSSGSYLPGETMLIGSDSAPTAAVKSFDSIAGGVSFWHGLGRIPGVGDGASGTVEFVYVKVGDAEYGESYHLLSNNNLPTSEQRWRTYPNPSQEFVIFEASTFQVPVLIKIFDLSGRLVINNLCRTNTCVVDVESIPNGMYLANVIQDSGLLETHRLVVIK